MLIRIIRRASGIIRHPPLGVCHSSSSGFSYVEILLAVCIMIIALAPLMGAVTDSFQSSRTGEENTLRVYAAREKLEDVLARDFNTVNISIPPGTTTDLSDTVTIAGRTVNRDVFVELYDGTGDSIEDPDIKKITVKIEGIQYDTLLSYY